ncbi:MAG: hypothetical protein A2007_05965 [Verrucomicrobia bacterium GWC2_42_7]|nr:MAG: hypothetical protein A2007_05965 [Verrucomicrobia bacterium GWC2_42_7]
MKKHSLQYASIFGLTALGLSLIACKEEQPKVSGKGGRPPAVITATPAVQKEGFMYVDAIGSCVAKESVKIVSQVSGQLMNICFSQGADVKKGDVLFKIDARSYQAVLDQKKSSLAMNQAKLALNEAQLSRSITLLQGQYVSQQDFDTYKANVEVSKANILGDQGTIAQAQLDVDHCTVVSPIDGRTSRFFVDAGNVIAADTALTNVQCLSPMYADCSLTERDFTLLKQHMNGHLKMEISSMVNPEKKAIADLFFVDNQISSTTGTIQVRAEMKNDDHLFWPGESINARIFLKDISDAVMVPAPSVQLNQKGRFVFVVKGDAPNQVAEIRPVVLGQLQEGNRVLIREGVKPGEMVATSGFVMLYPGARVIITDPSKPLEKPAGK